MSCLILPVAAAQSASEGGCQGRSSLVDPLDNKNATGCPGLYRMCLSCRVEVSFLLALGLAYLGFSFWHTSG